METAAAPALVIPFRLRTREHLEQHPVFNDPPVNPFFSGMDDDRNKWKKKDPKEMGPIAKSAVIDREAAKILSERPESVVINIGAGLDTRFQRLDNGRVVWYELDLPQVIDQRRRFFDESSRNPFLGTTVLDPSWTYHVDIAGRPVLVIADGLLRHFDAGKARTIFGILSGHFPGAEMLFDLPGPCFLRQDPPSGPTGGRGDVRSFDWPAARSKDLEIINNHLMVLEEWNTLDYHHEHRPWFAFWATVFRLKKRMGLRVVHVRLP